MIYKTISPTESQVGKYVDINGDGIPEGVIFADLAVGGEGQWGNEEYKEKYKIPTINDGLKDYIVIDEYNDQINGKQEVLAPILDGKDRFYIMALQDVGPKNQTWYDWANEKINFANEAKRNFGAGYLNTYTMMEEWNVSKYGEKNINDDLWNFIQEDVKSGWFLPSAGEWAAFTGQLGITKYDLSSKGLADAYWTSSLDSLNKINHLNSVFIAHLRTESIIFTLGRCSGSTRLAKTI